MVVQTIPGSEQAKREAKHTAHYKSVDVISETLKGLLITGGAGLGVSTIQASLTKQNIGAFGAFTKYGRSIAVFGAVGGAYEFAKGVTANLREKEDFWNATVGGLAAGAVLGIRNGTMSSVVGHAALAGGVLGVWNFTGGTWTGLFNEYSLDHAERMEEIRRNRRRPIEETIAELGEIRGIKAPGFEERRRQRLKEAYGYDIKAEDTE